VGDVRHTRPTCFAADGLCIIFASICCPTPAILGTREGRLAFALKDSRIGGKYMRVVHTHSAHHAKSTGEDLGDIRYSSPD